MREHCLDHALKADKPCAVNVTYNLVLFLTVELARAVTCRKPIVAYLVLKSDMNFEDFYAKLKIKVCDSLFPGQPVVGNNSFKMMFSVPRHVTNPLKLVSAADYAHLIANIAKIKTNPNAKIVIESHAPNLVCV